MIQESLISDKELIKVINPYLVKINPINQGFYNTAILSPQDLFFSVNRFDLIAKFIYIKYRELNSKTSWHIEVYKEHIRAFTFDTFKENDSTKKSIDDFIISFNLLIDSIKTNGFDISKSIIPINKDYFTIDGSHRVASCFYFNRNIPVVFLALKQNYDYLFFRRFKIEVNISDFMVLEYCKLNKRTRIVNVFPCGEGKEIELEGILKKYGCIYYKKTIQTKNYGPKLLIRQLYKNESWIGSDSNNYAGANYRAKISFKGKSLLRIYVYIPFTDDNCRVAKQEIRDRLYKQGNYPIHINDLHEETIDMSKIYFNENSIHYLNHFTGKTFENFSILFKKYKRWLQEREFDTEYFCIDSSSILSAYGIRECRDLDFLYNNYTDIKTGIPFIDSHNSEAIYHNSSIDDIIFNPKNHFYFDGLKFATIDAVRNMKSNRGEDKDIVDINLIDKALNPSIFLYVQIIMSEFVKEVKTILNNILTNTYLVKTVKSIVPKSKLYSYLKKFLKRAKNSNKW